MTNSWKWDTAPNGKGLLHSLTNAESVKTYSYTSKGQLERLTLTTSNESFSASWAHDDRGRVKTLTYPQPLGEAPFVLTKDYDDHGFVVGIHDSMTSYWELTDVDNAGRTKTETFGNGVTTTRGYHAQKTKLQNVSTMLNGSPIQQLSWDYDGLLNLKSRTDSLHAVRLSTHAVIFTRSNCRQAQ